MVACSVLDVCEELPTGRGAYDLLLSALLEA
jgi:hypothetical protein